MSDTETNPGEPTENQSGGGGQVTSDPTNDPETATAEPTENQEGGGGSAQ